MAKIRTRSIHLIACQRRHDDLVASNHTPVVCSKFVGKRISKCSHAHLIVGRALLEHPIVRVRQRHGAPHHDTAVHVLDTALLGRAVFSSPPRIQGSAIPKTNHLHAPHNTTPLGHGIECGVNAMPWAHCNDIICINECNELLGGQCVARVAIPCHALAPPLPWLAPAEHRVAIPLHAQRCEEIVRALVQFGCNRQHVYGTIDVTCVVGDCVFKWIQLCIRHFALYFFVLVLFGFLVS